MGSVAILSGTVFNDINGNGIFDANETGAPNVVVFVDANGNHRFDTGEQFTTTDAAGSYQFTGLAEGDYSIVQQLTGGASQTFPRAQLATSPQVTPAAALIRSVTSLDFDNDGDRDVVLTSQASGGIQVLRNDGAGNFSTFRSYSLGVHPHVVKSADVNGDGQADLIVTLVGEANRADSSALVVLLGNAEGDFVETSRVVAGDGLLDAKVTDVDRDGDVDVVATSFRSGEVLVFQNQGNGSFVLSQRIVTGQQPISIAVGDLDRDGDEDLVVANYVSDSIVRLTNNHGAFSLPQTVTTGLGPGYVQLGDLNGDQILDLAVSYYGRTGSNGQFQTHDAVEIFAGRNAGVFNLAQRINLDTSSGAEYLVLRDLDLDNDLDLLVVGSERNRISRYANNGGSFVPDGTIVTSGGPEWLVVDQFNSDGNPDVFVVGLNGSVSLFMSETPPIEAAVVSGQSTTGLDFGRVQSSVVLIPPASAGATHNEILSADTNNDGAVKLNDALLVINYLARGGQDAKDTQHMYLDVDDDGRVTLRDAVMIINYLASPSQAAASLRIVADAGDQPDADTDATRSPALPVNVPSMDLPFANSLLARPLTSLQHPRIGLATKAVDRALAEMRQADPWEHLANIMTADSLASAF